MSQVYPALARVPAGLFGICVVGTDGSVYGVGEADHPFALMSVSKPIVFALVCDLIGPTGARERLGVNATGYPFNSVTGVERTADGRTNPMVNAGAIATTSLARARCRRGWRFLHDGLSRFAGRTLSLDEEVYASAIETNFRNRGLVSMLESHGRLDCDPAEALDLYTRQCSLDGDGAGPRGDGGDAGRRRKEPADRRAGGGAGSCHYALAVMITAGLYETSGDWLYEIGLPGKSGIGGGIVAVSPGKGGVGHLLAAAR